MQVRVRVNAFSSTQPPTTQPPPHSPPTYPRHPHTPPTTTHTHPHQTVLKSFAVDIIRGEDYLEVRPSGVSKGDYVEQVGPLRWGPLGWFGVR